MMSSLSANRPPRGGMSNSALPIDTGDASAKFIRRSAKSVRFLVRPSVLGMVPRERTAAIGLALSAAVRLGLGAKLAPSMDEPGRRADREIPIGRDAEKAA